MSETADIQWIEHLDEDHETSAGGLLFAVRGADGRPELDADGRLPAELSHGPHAFAYGGDVLVGYAHLDQRGDAYGREVAELFVHPGHRGYGYGQALADAVARRAVGTLRYWAHGDHPAAARIAQRSGLRRARELLRMRAELDASAMGEPVLPEGVRLRTFEPGADEPAVVAVNARSFAWHPEQGGLTAEDLRASQREEWFDKDGFFLAEDADAGLLGFHWTKVHPPEPGMTAGGDHMRGVGEVYVVGVDPAAHGGGLGTALTVAGLRYLAGIGLREAILYVESDNPAAITVYNRLGFATETTDVQYELSR